MSLARPAVLGIGDRIAVTGGVHTVAALAEGQVRLVDVTGGCSQTPLGTLLADPSFRVLSTTARPRVPLAPQGLLDQLPPEVVERAIWWENHLLEVVRGLPAQNPPEGSGRPEYDPVTRSLRQREVAKTEELTSLGHDIGLSTLQRLRRAYETQGLLGLVDGRYTRMGSVEGRVEARVVEATRVAVNEATDRSTGTVDRLRRTVEQTLARDYGTDAPAMPSRATFYRLVERLASGRHTFGSARTRRSLAKRPPGPFGTVTASRPGEWVQIDSTPLDIRVVLDTGLVDRVELTWMIDMATRTIPAAVLRPTTKAPDAALLLARALTPEAMRPGWVDALRMSHSVLPHRRLVEIDQRLEHAAARLVIVPETIVCDHGKVYLSRAFRSACRALGVNLQPTHQGSPWQKGAVERSFDSLGTLFAQYVAGYVASNVERRGRDAEAEAVWSMVELQSLLDEWIVAIWQNRPHDGLRHPLTPGQALTPNEQYAALVEIAGYVPVALAPDDYIELLPTCWRTINTYGIKIDHRVYDCADLNPYRRQPSGITTQRGQWEVHRDPYDVSTIWVRNHHDGGWITVPWTQLRAAAVPFGDQVWQHARRLVNRRGEDPNIQQEITRAADALINLAATGPDTTPPASRADRRVAGRTRATTTNQRRPRPEPSPVTSPVPEKDDDLAEVIPLGIFDARKEAEHWW